MTPYQKIISTLFPNTQEAIDASLKSAEVMDSINTLAEENPATLSVIASAANLFNETLPEGNWLKPKIGVLSFTAGIGGLFQELQNGEFTVNDAVAASAAIGSILSRSNVPQLKVAGSLFSAYSLMLPTLVDFGKTIGKEVFYLVDSVNDFFSSSQSFAPPRRIDPLAIDLDGDGIETLAIGNLQNTTLFDHDNDGQAAGSGWLSSDDGWLVRDLDGNGAIDSGRELFGNNTILSDATAAAEGFSALADLDGNADGIIDANDEAFAELQVWQDLNQDGISQANELSSLTDLGIASFNLSSTEVNQEQNGNIIRSTSTFTRTDGTTSTIANLDLAESSLFTEYLDANVGDTSLPDIHGMGGVRNLRDAASRSSGLTTVIENIVNATTHDGRIAQLDNLVEGWAAISDMQSMKVAA